MVLRYLELLYIIPELVPGLLSSRFLELEDNEVNQELNRTILAYDGQMQGLAYSVYFVLAKVTDFQEDLVVRESIADIAFLVVAFEVEVDED